MKRMRIWIGLLLLAVCLTACSQPELPEDYIPKASDNPFLVETGYKKPEISLDGVLDDSKWEGLPEFAFGDEISATVKAFYGESGIYIGAVVRDPELWANSSVVYDNSSFEVYLDYSGSGGAKPESEQVQIFIDVNEQSMVRRGNGGLWQDTSFIKNYAVKVNGTLGVRDESNSYGVELFIPYSQLGGDPQVDYGIGFGLVGCKESVRDVWRGVSGINVQSPETYLKFYRDTNSVEYVRKVNSSNLVIDGKADEDAWADRLEYSFGDGGRGTVISCFDEKGCYFFFRMKDSAVCAEGSTVFLNDSVEVYLDALADGGTKPQTDDLQIRVDANGNIEVLRGLGAGEWNNALNNVFAAAAKRDGGYDVEYGVKIALENMWGHSQVDSAKIVPNVCSYGRDLADYYDALDPKYFTVCLDIGHCGLVGQSADNAIRELGHSRLHALHVHDTDHVLDLHTLPFQGKINWETVCKALAEIDYDGDFTYEVGGTYLAHYKNDKILMRKAFELMEVTGRKLISMIEEAKQ